MRKNPHAVALGRKGGKKGGRARMDGMTPAERKAFAKKGGKARQEALRRKRQELLNKMHDGRWMMERMKPFDRVDWWNRARDRSAGLFGDEHYGQFMRKRAAEALSGNTHSEESNRRAASA